MTTLLAIAVPFFPDPFGSAQSLSGPWSSMMQTLAWHLYLSLFLIELIVMSAQALLFKNSIVDYFRTFAVKVFVAIAFGWAITNASTLTHSAVNIFASLGASVSNCGTTNASKCAASSTSALAAACTAKLRYQCVPPPSANPDLEAMMLWWGSVYFAAAEAAHVADSSESGTSGITVGSILPFAPGNGDPGLAKAFAHAHDQFEIACIALGIICYTAAMAVWFTYQLLTFEMYVVLSLGIITMAFNANAATKAFARGFPQFVINLGVRFFAFYFVVVALSVMMNDLNPLFPIAGLVACAAIPMGIGSMTALFACSMLPLLAIMCAVCVYAVPQFAASLLKGGAALSVGAMWGQFSSAMSTAKQLYGKDDRQEHQGTRDSSTGSPSQSPRAASPSS